MRKRKIKLVASIASLAMVVAVMGVGVFAATSQSLGVTTTVSFTGNNVEMTVKGKLAGTYLADSAGFYDTQSTPTKLSVTEDWATLFTATSSTTTTSNSVGLQVALDDKSNGFIPKDSTITITYSIKNDSTTNTIYMKYTAPTISTAHVGGDDSTPTIASFFDPITVQTTNLTTYTDNGKTGYTLNANTTATIIITLTFAADFSTTLPANTTLLTDPEFGFYNGYGSLPNAPTLASMLTAAGITGVTIGEYIASGNAGDNQTVNATWVGYKYLTFGSSSERWIIIGENTDITIGNAVDTTTTDNDLDSGEILLLKETVVTGPYYFDQDSPYTTEYASSDCDLRNTLLNMKNSYGLSESMIWSGTGSKSGKIIPKVMTTAYLNGTEVTTSDTSADAIFTMACGKGYNNNNTKYDEQNFIMDNYFTYSSSYYYIGAVSNNKNLTSNANWWLRSGYYDISEFACRVSSGGSVSNGSVETPSEVRPAFVLNLG